MKHGIALVHAGWFAAVVGHFLLERRVRARLLGRRSSTTRATVVGLQAPSPCLRASSTRHINLGRCRWLADLTPLLALKKLREIDISWSYGLTEESLLRLSQLPHLELLTMEGCDELSAGALADKEGLTIER